MSPMQSAATKFVQTLSDPGSTPEAAQERAQEMMGLLRSTDPVQLDMVLGVVAEALVFDNPQRAGLAAVCGGALVENGASPAVLAKPLLAKLPEVLGSAARFYAEVVDIAGMQGEAPKGDTSYGVVVDGKPVPNAVVDAATQTLPKQANAFHALDMWCLPTIACLSLNADLRRWASEEGLMAYTVGLIEANGAAGFLHSLLRVLNNEPLLVLHPESRQGFQCKICGISSNFQLHTLLADALVKDAVVEPPLSKPSLFGKLLGRSEPAPPAPSRGWLPGQRPTQAIVAVARGRGPQQIPETSTGVWNLYQWFAVDVDGRLPKGSERRDSWIWNEGCPADIEPFDGTRIVLLGPPLYARSWSTSREFEKLKASVEVSKVLASVEVDDWLARLSKEAAKRPAFSEEKAAPRRIHEPD